MVWHIWWLAILGALGMLVAVIVRSADDDTEYTIPAAEVAQIENLRYGQLASVAKLNGFAAGRGGPEILPQV